MDRKLLKINLICRVCLAFVFIYQGLVPKILWISPVERALAEAHHLSADWVSPLAGVFEILLGLSLLYFKYSLSPVFVVMIAMLVLLLDVLIMMPGLLIEAFNPLTINLCCSVLALIIVITHQAPLGMNNNRINLIKQQ